jgi:anaerobic dimethyl sulfoxide reductase subunit B (iron-sulfur subunit)
MTYAFIFDAQFCSGCKACQAACKDKNNLPTGVLWRRVYEVSGGTWQKQGEAWNNTVFAYNISMACNHCTYPKCAGVCPTNAYVIRDDGIVLLDTSKCMGCGYCAWACPYGAPQYDPEAGCMTKCDLCVDQLEQGLPPACVAACPMRVLDYGEVTTERGIALWKVPPETHPYPLPGFSHTQPHLAIKPHPAMKTTEKKYVANREEIQPRGQSGWEDVPLILFTLLAQIAVGGYWAMSWMSSSIRTLAPLVLVGLCLGAGMLASFAHLGTKKNAWRALSRLRKSSLSREILFAGLFGLGWLLTLLETLMWKSNSFELFAITAILGIGLLYNMSQVYRFPAAPGWNTWRTNAGFMISALLLGHAIMAPVLAYEVRSAGSQITFGPCTPIGGGILVLLFTQFVLMHKQSVHPLLQNIRIVLMLGGVALAVASLLPLDLDRIWISALLFLIVLAGEGLGRWLFYESRTTVN